MNEAPYTKMTDEQIKAVMADALALDSSDESPAIIRLCDDMRREHSIEESEDYPGSYIVTYPAKTRAHAIMFREFVKWAANEHGFDAGSVSRWKDSTPLATGRHITEVWVAAKDFYGC